MNCIVFMNWFLIVVSLKCFWQRGNSIIYVKAGANRLNIYNMLYTMLQVECWDGLNMIWHGHITRYNMLENSKMSYNIFERIQKCWTVFPTLLMIFSMFERFKQTFSMLCNIFSSFQTFPRSKMRHQVRFVKSINSFYTEFLFIMASKRSNKKWQDG